MKTVSMSFLVVLCVGLQSMGAQLIFKNNARVNVPSCVLHVPDGDMYDQLATKGYIVKRDGLVTITAIDDGSGVLESGDIKTQYDLSVIPQTDLFLVSNGRVTQGLIGQQATTATYIEQIWMNEDKDLLSKTVAHTELIDGNGVGKTQLLNLSGLPNCK